MGESLNDSSNRPLHLLPGLGPITAQWLHEVGISSEAELRALGASSAYARLKLWDPKRATLNALWALHGAATGVPSNRIDPETKTLLLDEVGPAAKARARRR